MALVIYAFLALGGWVLYGAVWRLYLSPLSKFPGPKLAALTQWYEFYFNIVRGGLFLWEIERMHTVYGPIVRINPWEIHINDPDYYDELYAGGAKKRDKYPWFTAGGGSPGATFETNNHDLHRVRRGALNPFFSKRSITNIEPVILEHVSNLCDILREQMASSQPIDLRLLHTSLTLDIISHYCFGDSFGCLGNRALAEEWKHTLDDVFTKANLVMHFPWLLKIAHALPDSLAGPVIRHHRNTRKHVAAILNHEEQIEKNQNTIFHELRDSDLPQSEKTVSRLAEDGNILIGAGSETTAQVLAILSFHLLDNPDMLAKLRAELETVMPSVDTEITWSQLEQLPYLTGVVNEGLRLSSPAITRLPRIAPNEVLRYGTWEIPAGTPISMSYFLTHYNPQIYPEPKKFDPDRWVRAQVEGQRLDRYLVPFSKGSRNCVGLNLAYAELYLATAVVFRRFVMQLFETDRSDVDIARDCFVSQPVRESKGIRVKVVKESL